MLCHSSHVWFCAMLWTIDCLCPLSMGFSRQEHLSGLPCSPLGDLPDPRIKLGSPALQADSLPLSHVHWLVWILVYDWVSIFSAACTLLYMWQWMCDSGYKGWLSLCLEAKSGFPITKQIRWKTYMRWIVKS